MSVLVGLSVSLLAAGCGSGATPSAAPGSNSGSTSRTSGPTAMSTTTAAGAGSAVVPGAAAPCGSAPRPPARYQHVVWIWMENHTWSSVIGSPDAPYVTSLAHKCATDSNYSSVGSPSLPNYLGATSGSTNGVTDDADPAAHPLTVDNLFRQVRTAGGTERSFEESMQVPCQQVSAGSYAAKHNPAAYYVGPGDRAACKADDVAFSNLPPLLTSGKLPTFSFVTPNICDDMHSCPTATGDRWLSTWVPRILASPAYGSGSTAVFVVWDEPTPLANVEVAPSIRPGTASAVAVDHYSLLRATEEMLGLPLLGHASSATSLRGVVGA